MYFQITAFPGESCIPAAILNPLDFKKKKNQHVFLRLIWLRGHMNASRRGEEDLRRACSNVCPSLCPSQGKRDKL